MSTDKSLAGKTAFITGGGSGINFGIAYQMAVSGANVALCGRTQEKLNAATKRLKLLGVEAFGVPADVRDSGRMSEALAESERMLGSADIVVCGAAGNFLCDAENLSPNGFKSVIDIDLLGSFNTARASFEQLKHTRGLLLFISAGQSMMPYRGQVHAGAAKAGIDNMMRTLALEWGKYGIRSNSIMPGFIQETEGVARIAGEGKIAQVVQHTPLGRLGTVEDIGRTAVFLASAGASFITGAIFTVDGGHYLGGSAALQNY